MLDDEIGEGTWVCPKCGGDNAYSGASLNQVKTMHDAWCPDGSGKGFETLSQDARNWLEERGDAN